MRINQALGFELKISHYTEGSESGNIELRYDIHDKTFSLHFIDNECPEKLNYDIFDDKEHHSHEYLEGTLKEEGLVNQWAEFKESVNINLNYVARKMEHILKGVK